MELSDGAVTLRAWTEADAPVLVECIDGDPEIARWLDRVPQPYTHDDAIAYIGGIGGEAFAIVADGRVVGSIGVHGAGEATREIGYWLRRDARGTGLMVRALRLAGAWALAQEDTARVQLRAAVGNDASRRVAESAGFRFEGILRSAAYNARLGRRVDWAMYSLLPGELT